MSKRWIGVSKVEGKSSRQAHCDLPEGTYEREMGKEGFFGPACHMYHANPPTAWTSFEGPLRPRAFDTNKFAGHGDSPWRAHELMHNAHCRLRAWRCASSMDHLVRNADGDELLFVHNGSGHLFCDYGHLAIEAGDYIVLPRSTTWRLEVTSPLDGCC
jgi:homogentisate 1,2-dioxygenase